MKPSHQTLNGIAWISRDAREQQQMIDYVIKQLRDEDASLDALSQIGEDERDYSAPYPPQRISEREAIHKAERGNYAPLRALYPHLAKHLNPKLKQGQRPLHKDGFWWWVAEGLVDDLKRVRKIWLRDFGYQRRPASAEPSTEKIVAVYHGIDVERVHAAVKLLSR